MYKSIGQCLCRLRISIEQIQLDIVNVIITHFLVANRTSPSRYTYILSGSRDVT